MHIFCRDDKYCTDDKMDLNLVTIVIATSFLCISAVGNSLSFIAVTNKHCKKSSYTVYIAVLAITDLLAIRITCPCVLYPRTPHFYIVKLGFTGVYFFFLFLLQNIDCGYSLERVPTIHVLSKNKKKNITIFHLKIIIFAAVKNCCILHGRVFVMAMISLSIPRYLGRSTVNLSATNELYCKLRLFVTYTCAGISLWLVILLALERTFCMYFPFKVKSVCRPRTALIATALLVTVIVANNSHYIYVMRLQQVRQYGELGETSFRSESENENVTLPISELAPFGNLSNGNNDNHNHSGENKDERNILVFKGDPSANHATDSIHDGPANSAHDDQTDKGKSDMTTNFV